MFGRQPKEKNQTETSEISSDMFSPSTSLDLHSDDTELDIKITNDDTPQPEIVNVVEKISGILSPYFIVIVGLFLYEDNFLIGTTLIAVGILSLFKVSLKDLGKLFDSLKKSLGLDK